VLGIANRHKIPPMPTGQTTRHHWYRVEGIENKKDTPENNLPKNAQWAESLDYCCAVIVSRALAYPV
ncbi:MAG: hypothetical protein PVG22_00850, partial [Chromatiales bacterium]